MILKSAVVAALISIAPMQCAHDPDPNARREDSPGDALWSLAQKCESEHDDDAARQALKYLVDQYPSNRHAEAARAKLGGASTSAPADHGDAGNSG